MIRSVRIKGFRRYVDEKAAFGPGANFVEGENNAGKTSLLYAIEYALFGRVEGFKTLMGLLHAGSRGMGVQLEFDGRDGGLYRLQRVHQMPPKSRSKLEGHFTLKRLPKAEGEAETYLLSSDFQDHEDALALKLQELTGLTRRFFALAVHMRQGEIARILEGSPELDIVLGVTAAVIASDELRAQALELEKEAAALPVLEESARRLAEDRQRLAGDIAAAEAERGTLGETVRRLEATVQAAVAADAGRQPLLHAYHALAAAEEAHRDASRRHHDAEERVRELVTGGSADDRRGDIAAAEVRAAEIAGLRSAAAAAAKEAEGERRELDRSRGDLAGRIGRREGLPTGGDARCEVCGNPIDAAHNARELAVWRDEVRILDDRIAALTATIDEATTRRHALDAEDKDLALRTADARRHLADLEKATADEADRRRVTEGEASKRLEAADQARGAIAAWTGDPLRVADGPGLEGAGTLRESLAAVLSELGRTLGEKRARAEAERDGAQERLDSAAEDLAELGERAAEVEREHTSVQGRLGELRRKAERAERLRKLSAGFKDLQGTLRERASAALAADAHALHGKLSIGDDRAAEFDRIVVDPQKYSVQVVPKHIGEEVPAALYEGGGHRLLLGLAFKLAVARLAGHVPFVMLDEPTYGLDDRHRATLLDRIADLGVSEQILLITHETMGRAGGRRVRVTRNGDQSHIAEVP